MKIKRIVDNCKKAGELYITDVDGVQWVGNSRGMYPLVGLPKFTPESLCDTFGINEETQSKMILNEKELKEWGKISFGELTSEDEAAEIVPVGVIYSGRSLACVKSEGSIYFIDRRLFNPFDESFELFKRRFGPVEYFVVSQGFFVVGIIFPEMEYRAQLAGELKELVKLI